jgi:hypothetical protein
MLIRVNGVQDTHALHLGVQTNPDRWDEQSLLTAKHWAPAMAKSFTLERKGTTAIVRYYTTLKEGKVRLDSVQE